MKSTALFLAVAATAATGIPNANADKPMTLSLKPYAGTSLRTVDVTLGDRTSPFIFDTGGGSMLINPDQIPNAGCKPFGQVTGFRATGEALSMPRCGPIAMNIDGFKTTDEVAVFDLTRLIGKDAPPVGGLMGMTPFSNTAVTLDMANDRAIVETPASLKKRVRHMQPLNLRIVRGAGGDIVPFIQIKAKTGTLWMEVDSGNNGPAFLSPVAAKQMGIELNKDDKKKVDLDVIGLGKIPVTVMNRKMIFDGQLNPEFLKQMVITFDFAHGKAWAKRNAM